MFSGYFEVTELISGISFAFRICLNDFMLSKMLKFAGSLQKTPNCLSTPFDLGNVNSQLHIRGFGYLTNDGVRYAPDLGTN